MYDGDGTALLHLARPNPVWRALSKTPEHRTDIAERLADRDAPGDRAARDHLLRRP